MNFLLDRLFDIEQILKTVELTHAQKERVIEYLNRLMGIINN